MWLLLLVAICRMGGPPCPVGQRPVVLRTYDDEGDCLALAANLDATMDEEQPQALAHAYCQRAANP